MPILYNITNDWNEQPWFSTGGTRAKKYLQSPEGRFYYFKRSQYKEATPTKPGKDFKYEFWSEVIAYELGSMIGFTMLRYDIAIDGEIMGCISETMINAESEELVEGVKYLQAFSPKYDPSSKEHQSWYTFYMIENALQSAGIKEFIDNILELIVFDALIGNGDRHQENWAIITKQRLITELYDELELKGQVKFDIFTKWFIRKVKSFIKKQKETGKNAWLPKSYYVFDKGFAPIYDSGSSLGRELLDEKVNKLLESDEALLQYVEGGLSEIRWENQKLTHFELIRNLLKSVPHKGKTAQIIKMVLAKYNPGLVEKIVKEIDNTVPESHAQYKIPDNRKKLITKIIHLRFQKLQELIDEGV